MAIFDFLKRNKGFEVKADLRVDGGLREAKDDGIFKAFVPDYLYKPPFGYPRRVNTVFLKQLSKNPYVFSVIKTLADEATSMGWEITVKDEFNTGEIDYDEKIKEITKFLRNPNGNEESFEHLLRQVIVSLIEADSGVLVKVFNQQGDLKHVFARDGSTFLKNPDIYGYLGHRSNFVMPLPDGSPRPRLTSAALLLLNHTKCS